MITKQQRNAGMVFMALGAYVIIYTLTKLKIGSISSPGPGFFTFICGAAILVLASVLVIGGFVKGAKDRPIWEKGQWIRPLLAYVVAIGYSLLIMPLGFILATALFILVWQIIVEHEKPLKIALFTVIGSLSMWVLFEKLLRVPLPNGLLPW